MCATLKCQKNKIGFVLFSYAIALKFHCRIDDIEKLQIDVRLILNIIEKCALVSTM